MLLAAGSLDVVVVAGLPGAGKTTLAAGEPAALDSDAVRERWEPRLRPLPYELWRPLVHLWHWTCVWRALGRPQGVVVVRPFTTGWLRRAVLRRARRHHRYVHLVVVEATPAQARAGQLARGRTLGERAMRRHERRWAGAPLEQEGWTSVLRLARRGSQAPPAGARTYIDAMTWTCPGNVTSSVGQGTGTPSVTPGTDGLPSMAGLPMTMTLVEIDAPGVGITVDVVQGLEPGEGGTGHVVGLAEMSPAQIAGEPPIMTLVCFGKTVTGPAWQQVMTAELLTSGGMGPRSIPALLPRGNRRPP